MSEGNTLSKETQNKNGASRPPGFWVVIVLTALMFYRIVGFFGLTTLGDTQPMGWIVAFTGDAFMGVTALIVAGLLWKYRGLGVWTIAIVWHVIGIKDYLAGTQLAIVEPPIDAEPGGLGVFFVIFGVGILLHIISIYLLSRNRNYYLGKMHE